jgi:uncharacterized protein YqgV (UPF0045/DUF77 family)
VQHVSCQFSVYPLGVADLGEGIDAVLVAIRRRGLSVGAGAMSGTMDGASDDVFAALGETVEATASGACVVVATVSNACAT